MKKKHHKKDHHKKEHHKKDHHKEMPHHEKEHHKKKAHHKNFIQGAIKHPGALRKELHAKKGHDIPEAKLEKAAHAKGKLGRRARLAITLKRLGHRKAD